MKVISNFISGMLSVITASQASTWQRAAQPTFAEALLVCWKGVAKDIKRVQGKLKAEAHDRRK